MSPNGRFFASVTTFSSSETTRCLWLNIGAALDYSCLSGPRQLPTQGWNHRTQVGPSPGFNCVAWLKPEFDKRNTRIIGLSVDPVSDHKAWVNDIKETQGHAVDYPLIGDPDLSAAKFDDVIHSNANGGPRTAVDNATVCSVFIIGPDK